jgi:CheY-like chemotaxis protein
MIGADNALQSPAGDIQSGFFIARRRARPSRAMTKTSDSAQPGAAVVLCIDGDRAALKLAEAALREAGYSPVCETDAEAALLSLEEQKPAAIVLELLMPRLDGFEFLERFQRMSNTPAIPIIVWTIMKLPPEDRSRLQAFVQAIVTKGHSGAAPLLEELEKHIGQPRGTSTKKDRA